MAFKEQFLGELLNRYEEIDIEGITPEIKTNFNSLAAYLLTPSITPKSLGVTYATIKYWEKKGYLLINIPKEVDQWRRYTILEFLWFKVLVKLGDLGCAIEKVAPKLINAYTNYSGYNEIVPIDGTELTHAIVINDVRINTIEGFLKHTILTILGRSNTIIAIRDAECEFFIEKSMDRISRISAGEKVLWSTGINISISDILFDYVLGLTEREQEMLQIFNNEEKEVIKLLSQEDIREISVKQTDGKIYELKSVEKFPLENLNKPLKSIITEKYQEIEVKTYNKGAFVIKTTKHPLHKVPNSTD